MLQTRFDGYVRNARQAASSAAGVIKGAIDDAVKDNWWERNAGWLNTAKTVLGWAASAAGIALAVVAAVATAPVWLVVLAVGLAVATLVISLGLALKADGSRVDVLFDAIGVVSLGIGSVATRLASRAFPAVRSAVAGTRASQAHRARFAREAPENLTELRRYASGATGTTGTTARQLLAEARAAAAARGSTFAPFQVTRQQQIIDGGLEASRVRRQATEMVLDLCTMPVPAPAGLVRDASSVSHLSTAGSAATNIGAGSQVVQTVTERDWTDGGNMDIVTDLVQRAR